MPVLSKDCQISVRIPRDTDAKAGERKLLAMFNEAAAHVTKEDLEERETLLGGFAMSPSA
jgi:hypothetical protein